MTKAAVIYSEIIRWRINNAYLQEVEQWKDV